MNELVFSGIQPTGNLHLGNYLGAIKNWVALQHKYRSIFCIVDMHAITVPQNPAELLHNVRLTAATYIACGIDPEKNIIFAQSSVPGHAELAWILGCSTPMGWLNRMTQFKDKVNTSKLELKDELKKIKANLNEYHEAFFLMRSKKARALASIKKSTDELESLIEDQNKVEKAELGLFSYPVLMAADILLYKTTHVPVGEDQKQHLELARDVAGAFNRQFKTEYFPIPEPMMADWTSARVMSLRDGMKKMSKSEESDYSRINLTDDANAIRLKIQKAKTDTERSVTKNLGERPEARNLLNIYCALANIKVGQEVWADNYSGLSNRWGGFGDFKKALADAVVSAIAPISTEIHRVMNDTSYIDSILKSGAEKAGAIAEKNMREIKRLVGFPVV